MTAAIIAFPRRPARPAVPAPISAPVPASILGGRTMENALDDLRTALDDQQRVLGEWRFAIAEFSIGVTGLGFALEGFEAEMDAILRTPAKAPAPVPASAGNILPFPPAATMPTEAHATGSRR